MFCTGIEYGPDGGKGINQEQLLLRSENNKEVVIQNLQTFTGSETLWALEIQNRMRFSSHWDRVFNITLQREAGWTHRTDRLDTPDRQPQPSATRCPQGPGSKASKCLNE